MAKKFSNPDTTADGKTRAWVAPNQLETLWFNTGTLCNLECKNCYIESSPRNDRLVYIEEDDVREYLDEIAALKWETKEIAFTGGEPFLNPNIIPILRLCLERGFSVLVLTNAMKPMQRHQSELLDLLNEFGTSLSIRVSLDHYSESLHGEERGEKAWKPAITGLRWLSENNFFISVAGRTIWDESIADLRQGYSDLFSAESIAIDADDPGKLILFPEMDAASDVPEITTECWGILNKDPNSIMCASSRMIVKRKGNANATVVACTLLPYEPEFDYGHGLQSGFSNVKLNHPHCATFCVLGGGSCTNS